jgi:hypothetical protein
MAATIKKHNEKGNDNATEATDATDTTANAAAEDVKIATTTSCTPNEFINAFNKQRTVLAGFAHCTTIEELHIVRDGFIFGLAKDICPDQYKSVLILILRKQFASQKQEQTDTNTNNNNNVIHIPPETTTKTKTTEKGIENDHGMLSMSFEEMVLAARICDENNDSNGNDANVDGNNNNDNDNNNNKDGKSSEICNKDDATSSSATIATIKTSTTTCYWNDLIKSVKFIAKSIGSDLDSIWNTLEDGRLVWIRAVNAAHPMKLILKHALKENNTENSPGDVSDGMMVWIYCLCINLIVSKKSETKSEPSTVVDENDDNNNNNLSLLSQLQNDVDQWFIAVNMKDKYNPLQGYQSELWDPRRDEWRSLDIGAQTAAERGGTTLFDAWNA